MTDGVPELLATFAELGSAAAWAARVGNEHKTSRWGNAPLKAVAIKTVAERLEAAGIFTTDDLRAAAADPARKVATRALWTGVVGQSTGMTWHYVLMLANVPGVKPDRMIKRFVGAALSLNPVQISNDFVVEIVTATAQALNLDASTLDHGIWSVQRGTRRRR